MPESKTTPVNLAWEWPGDSKPDARMVVRVDNLTAQRDGGPFGLRRSPSIAASLPEPVELSGTVISGESDWAGRAISLVLPSAEIAGVRSDDRVALGVLGAGTCICVEKLPREIADHRLRSWLAAWDCTHPDNEPR